VERFECCTETIGVALGGDSLGSKEVTDSVVSNVFLISQLRCYMNLSRLSEISIMRKIRDVSHLLVQLT
jgi:hypothetical protein